VRAAIYARVSTSNGSQTCENQLLELRRYCEARGWIVYAEYTDEMSGAKDRRPGLVATGGNGRFDGWLGSPTP
jgi:DNA invertase Pin-like site-specific DNA recombinase